MSLPGKLPDPGAKRSNGATRARNVRRYGAMPHGATSRRPGGLSTERWAKQSQKVGIIKKSGAEHSIQRHSSSPTGLSGGCAKPIFDHAHERSAKRQGERGLILCPLSSNLPYQGSPASPCAGARCNRRYAADHAAGRPAEDGGRENVAGIVRDRRVLRRIEQLVQGKGDSQEQRVDLEPSFCSKLSL